MYIILDISVFPIFCSLCEYACYYPSLGCVSCFMVSFAVFPHIIKAVGGNVYFPSPPYLYLQLLQSFSTCSPHLLLNLACFTVWKGCECWFTMPNPPPPSEISTSKPWEMNSPPLKRTNLLQLNKGLHHSQAPLCCHVVEIQLWKRARSALSRVGSRLGIEKGLTRGSRTESRLGHVTGRGNRRLEVIRDVINRRRKSPSVGDTVGLPTELDSLATNARLETTVIWQQV